MSNKYCGKTTRLMKKRDLVSYYVLCLEEGRVWNIGEAIDELVSKVGLTRRIAYSVLRRFRRTGLIVKTNDLEYRCYGFLKYIEDLYRSYVCRKKRLTKS
ncbi:MAG: hypothetical protein QXP72_05590 [Desulfurococcaceae archaeon]